MAFLELKGLTKGYGVGVDRAVVLDGIDLAVEEGEFIAIVGFSGSGKTTLISAIAGLIEPDAGEILLKGERVKGPDPERGVVFRSMPWIASPPSFPVACASVWPWHAPWP